MLTEMTDVSQDMDDATRRWFTGDSVELVLWEDDRGVRVYQLRYRRPLGDGVYQWRRDSGLSHYLLDDGESRAARVDAAPLLTPSDDGPREAVLEAFRSESEGLDPDLRTTVESTLRDD